MARIPEAEIERLKAEVSVERLVTTNGIALKRAGKDLLAHCPFHEDREASLVVTPAKNLWHCFGCQVGGGPIDWVMKMNGVSFRHAVELLREGTSLAAARPVKESTVRKLPAPVAFDVDDQRLLNQTIGYYHETLKAAPEALAYLKARGIDHPEAIERFKLGFANRTLGLRLPEKNRIAGAEMRERLQRLGLLRASGHEHFNGSLVIPVMDESGNVTEVYGRKITERLKAGTPLHLYLPGEGRINARGVWNVEALAASKEIILCEALIDALTFWCAGYRNVTAAYGVEGFTGDHLAAFKRYGTERVLIAYDRDDAGERAAEKLAEQLIAAGIEAWRIQFPHGMDANEYALKVAPASKSLGIAIRKALWLGKGVAPARLEAVVAIESSEVVHAPARAGSSLAAEAAKEENPQPLPASPMPSAPAPEIAVEVKDTEVTFTFGENGNGRRYRIRGLAKNLGYEVMKVNALVASGERFYVDTLDLYAARARASYITQAAVELALTEDVVKADLGRVLLRLEALQEQNIKRALEPKPVEAVSMDTAERAAAMALLRSPNLPERILADLEACGIVGEKTNKLVGYLAATSRKLDSPLAVLVQSSSAAGKSSLMDAVLAMMPEEERIKYSAVTGQSLFYMGQSNLKHKILAIVEEEGASRASYALKLLQSEGELTIASTGKDPDTGDLVTREYRVEGPVMMFLTTTAIDIDPELQNRCLVLSIDEGREQTKAIHRLQREKRTLDGLLARARKNELLTVHRNAQRLLRPLGVLNPYANRLTFPDTTTRLRRDHEKYLTLIDTIALLHQFQREVKALGNGEKTVEYVEVMLDDIALANSLAHEVLGRSLDELPPQTRRVLLTLDAFVAARAREQGVQRAQVRFSRREVREHAGISDTQLRLHLDRLVALEYMLARRDGAGGRLVYELVYDGAGQDGRPFVPGLIDVEALATATAGKLAGLKDEVAGGVRADRGPVAGGSLGASLPETPRPSGRSAKSGALAAKTQCSGDTTENAVVALAVRARA
jgi:DNA primase catalytic core